VLLVESDHELRNVWRRALERAGCDVFHRCCGLELGDLLASPRAADHLAEFALVICGERMFDASTLDAVGRLQRGGQFPPLALLRIAEGDGGQGPRPLETVAVFDDAFRANRRIAELRAIAGG
jgi:hypothetical protein